MRIGIIASPWLPVPPPAYGGTELVIDLLARGFADAGHDVLLAAAGDSTCPVPQMPHKAPAEFWGIGTFMPEFRHIRDAYQAMQGFDIIHDVTLVGPLYADRFPELKVITTNHGPFDDYLCDFYRAVSERHAVITISKFQAAQVPDIPIAATIHHGLISSEYPMGDGSGGYLLFLGKVSADKGPHRAAAVAKRAGVPLIIAAKMREPVEREFYEEVLQPMLDDQIQYVGEVGGKYKKDLIAGATALINPIRRPEPFGLVMIEAMACGTPVLAFPEGAAPEIVNDGVTGFLCEDEDAMVEAVGKLNTIDRSSCRASVEDYFSADRMVAEYLDLFERILAKGYSPEGYL